MISIRNNYIYAPPCSEPHKYITRWANPDKCKLTCLCNYELSAKDLALIYLFFELRLHHLTTEFHKVYVIA